MAGHGQGAFDPCEQILVAKPPVASGQYAFSGAIRALNLRPETRFPMLRNLGELREAFLRIRDSHVVKVETLELIRGIFRSKVSVASSGYGKIPWEFSENYCGPRAALAAAVLADAGYPTPVAVTLVTDHQRLVRATEENEETPDSLFPSLRPQEVLSISGNPKLLIGHQQVEWSWHVSLAYVVEGELWILDPSVSYEAPIPFSDWHRRLAAGIPEVEVEVTWPHADRPGENLANLYAKFQRQTLLGFSKGKITLEEKNRLTAVFSRVTGPLKSQPDAKFIP
ncbi:MAG: protein-glutamine glutaminase family protein [Bdellovibrionales bacterium]